MTETGGEGRASRGPAGARPELDVLVERALAEDVGAGDWTTLWTVAAEAAARAVIVAKQALVVAGTEAAERTFLAVDPDLLIDTVRGDGVRAGPGEPVLRVEGSARGILTAERTALNFLGRLSGIATWTDRFVAAVRGTGARVVDTRKTTPGWRALEKAAVRSGGGTNHRSGLYDMVLIKDNHAAAAGGVVAAVERVFRENAAGLPVEVEVRTLEELEAVLPMGVDRILLDNMSPGLLREAVRRTGEGREPRPLLEASGNVTLETVAEVARTGVDLVSVGALTHSAPAADLSLRIVG